MILTKQAEDENEVDENGTFVPDADMLVKTRRDAVVIDLASKPGGVDFETARKMGIKVIVSDYDIIKICNDKWETYKFLSENNFYTPIN